jgi:hypothetical protein
MDIHPQHEKDRSSSSYPSPLAVLFAMAALSFLCMTLGSGIVALTSKLQGIDMTTLLEEFGKESPVVWRNYMRGVLLINHMLTFLVPAALLGWLIYRHAWSEFLGIRHSPKPSILLIGIIFTAVAFPLAQSMFEVNRLIIEKAAWLQSLVDWESKSDDLVLGMLVMQSPWEMLFSLLVMAVVPAIGEELVFRGVVQQTIQKWIGRPNVSVFLTAFVFSLVHFQVQRFFAIFFLGLVLGYLFYWTKNLWVSIAAHFFNNAMQVVVAFFMQDKLDELNSGESGDLPTGLILISAALFLFIGSQLIKRSKKPE